MKVHGENSTILGEDYFFDSVKCVSMYFEEFQFFFENINFKKIDFFFTCSKFSQLKK
jgi:hypothetical protein